MTRCTARGEAPTNPEDASVPTSEKLSDGQYRDHWVLCDTERAKGFIRPLRHKYQHVGRPGPQFPLRDLTDEQKVRMGSHDFVKFEPYPPELGPALGRYWTQEQLDKIGKGCGTVTSMPHACAETYARQPGYYGSTFCCGCGSYLPVGRDGEFVWDGTNERVGT